jgi:hypothetical protein
MAEMSANMKALYASETPGGAALDGGGKQLEKLGRSGEAVRRSTLLN